MPALIQEEIAGKVVEVTLSGKLTRGDYDRFVPQIEHLLAEHDKLRLLVVMTDFHGWTAGGLWDDIKFDARHFRDIERLAFVGDKRWEKGMATFCKPFTRAKIRYFDHESVDEARRWIHEP
ncbi:MAG: STAS/SEC14 domain-containing protein [Planctomycetes bacterium]|nr:STAS/SEC14 domain-containing protein [Planctomycetota bacterium]